MEAQEVTLEQWIMFHVRQYEKLGYYDIGTQTIRSLIDEWNCKQVKTEIQKL